MVTPNRIVLISRGRHDEAPADADVYPGMLLAPQSDGGVQAHAVAGGLCPLMVCEEDALQGGDITQKIKSGSVVPFRRPGRGDKLLMLLQNGQNCTAAGLPLQSAGDGTLTLGSASLGSTVLADITAPSSTVTNTTTSTIFSNGSYAFPANFLQVGDVIRVRAKAYCIAVAAAATQQVRLFLNTTVVADGGAVAMVAADVAIIDAYLTIRTLTATGAFVADGQITTEVAGTFTVTPFTLATTAFDATAIQTLSVQAKASAAATGNQIRLDEFNVVLVRASGGNTVVYSDEAINNSGGTGTSGFNTAAFIRVYVP